MTNEATGLSRRALLTGGLGVAALAMASPAGAAEPTAAERANMRIVEEFCAAWPSHDLDRILAFFADNGVYRMTETMEPAKGREALKTRISTIINNVTRFEILDTWYTTVEPDSWPVSVRSNVLSVDTKSLLELPESAKFDSASVPAVAAVSTVTLTVGQHVTFNGVLWEGPLS